jgi:hypothetical protein
MTNPIVVPTTSTTTTAVAPTSGINRYLDNFLSSYNRTDIVQPTFFYDSATKQVFFSQGQNFLVPADKAITDAVNSGQAVLSNGTITNTVTGLSTGTSTWLTDPTVATLLPKTAVSTYGGTTTTPTVPVVSVPGAIAQNTQPPSSTTVPVIPVPKEVTDGTTSTTTPSSVGPAVDSISLLEYANRLKQAEELESRAGIARDLTVRLAGTRKETDVRKAEADAYNAALKAVASLGARGIQGLSGLRVAAQRAARSEPMQRRVAALAEYAQRTGAADLLLADEKAKALQARQEAETANLRAQKLANDLSKSTGTVTTVTPTTIPTLTLSPQTTSLLNPQQTSAIPTIQVPRM